MTTSLLGLLSLRYSSPDYVFLSEVPNGTGGYKRRSADAIAFSLWPSRGLTITGFEIKVERSDWLRELKEPAKADEIARFCHFWFLVSEPGVAKPEEVPQPWGWLERHGDSLKVKKPCEGAKPEPVSYPFLMGIMRRFSAGGDHAVEAAVQKALNEKRRTDRESRDYRELAAVVERFETESGIDIRRAWQPGRVGKKVIEFLNNGGVSSISKDLSDLKMRAHRIAEEIDGILGGNQ